MSLYQPFTVLVPVPLASVQLLVPVIANQVVQVEVFDRQASATPEVSVAERVTVTVLLLVYAAALLTEIVPVGAVYSGAGRAVAAAPVERLPAASTAHRRNE